VNKKINKIASNKNEMIAIDS